MKDFIRVAAAVPNVSVGDTEKNTENIINMMKKASENQPQLIVFPELSITGYTCQDLFFQEALLSGSLQALKKIIIASKDFTLTAAVGIPLKVGGGLYNCAAIISAGKLHGIVTKTYIPTYNEFYEMRWFNSGNMLKQKFITPEELCIEDIASEPVPIGNDLIFDAGAFKFGAEICEDLWATVTPGSIAALHGAEVIINLSASNETISKRLYRRNLVSQQSAAQLGAYVYASAGCTESTTDLIFSGHSLIAENGKTVAENKNKIDTDYILFSDIDLGKIRADRAKIKTFGQNAAVFGNFGDIRTVKIPSFAADNDLKFYTVEKHPFVPSDDRRRKERCLEIFEMQVMGLKKRMDVTSSAPVIGVSGGLDSTLALLVCVEAARRCGRSVKDVTAITMPCFGTTGRTHRNSLSLMEKLGVTSVEIPIADAVNRHFKDIGHDGKTLDLTYENAQARERTQVLMDYAGKVGGFVAGTGDLSELALGWCTYNADHMSMYGVNCGVPKTLVRWMVASIAECEIFKNCRDVLRDILDTPISPELLPPDDGGNIAQQTEQVVGPYALHDFFLYYAVRFGFAPSKIYALACKAFDGEFDKNTIKKWLVSFYRRFFSQQFKRSCLPDGVKIGSICLSPRGDWRMPSDAAAAVWVKEAERL